MQTKIVRFFYRYRHLFRWMIFIHRPVLLKLADFKIYVRLDDWAVGARIAVKRKYETHVTTYMRHLLKPGHVVVDIGANIGYYTLLAASQVGDTGKVIAFEPHDQNCTLINMSLQANKFTNVVVHPYAVLDKKGEIGFNIVEGSSNGVIDLIKTSRYQVDAIQLDTFLKNEHRIDIVKLDIEGAEGLALKGMHKLIQQHQPIIFTEFSPHSLITRSGISAEEYLDRLHELGYQLFILHRKGGISSKPHSKEQIMKHFEAEVSEHLDLIAFPKKQHEH